jgi:hypothetical protein
VTEEAKCCCDCCCDDIVGKPISEIETPALVVDLDIMESNMDKMMAFLKECGAGVGIRPHAKSHKTPEIAKIQMAKGALGRDPAGLRLLIHVIVAFIPAAVIGLLLHDWIDRNLFTVAAVISAQLAGAVLMFAASSAVIGGIIFFNADKITKIAAFATTHVVLAVLTIATLPLNAYFVFRRYENDKKDSYDHDRRASERR